jgi:hypothetical protein
LVQMMYLLPNKRLKVSTPSLRMLSLSKSMESQSTSNQNRCSLKIQWVESI